MVPKSVSMCEYADGEPFSAPWDSETPERIELKFGTIDYVRHATPHAKLGWRRIKGVGWGRGENVTSRAFYFF